MTALVAKIGGSLWRSQLLARWIAALSAYPGMLTIVPGGGPFADAVRAAQGPMGYSDRAAHEMALLAMEQYGIALCDLFPGLALAATVEEAKAIRAQGGAPVWRPRAMTLASDIPASWDVTSDSLAAWYAQESGAARLLVVKSVDARGEGAAASLVDACFCRYARALSVSLLGPAHLEEAEAGLRLGVIPSRGNAAPTPIRQGISVAADEPVGALSEAVLEAVRLRPATFDDARRLHDLRRRSILALAPQGMASSRAEAWARALSLDGMERKLGELEIWIAGAQEYLLGWSAACGDRIEGLYVAPEFASRGVGTTLLEAIEQRMRERSFSSARLESSPNAEGFYRRRGYEVISPPSSEGSIPMRKVFSGGLEDGIATSAARRRVLAWKHVSSDRATKPFSSKPSDDSRGR